MKKLVAIAFICLSTTSFAQGTRVACQVRTKMQYTGRASADKAHVSREVSGGYFRLCATSTLRNEILESPAFLFDRLIDMPTKLQAESALIQHCANLVAHASVRAGRAVESNESGYKICGSMLNTTEPRWSEESRVQGDEGLMKNAAGHLFFVEGIKVAGEASNGAFSEMDIQELCEDIVSSKMKCESYTISTRP